MSKYRNLLTVSKALIVCLLLASCGTHHEQHAAGRSKAQLTNFKFEFLQNPSTPTKVAFVNYTSISGASAVSHSFAPDPSKKELAVPISDCDYVSGIGFRDNTGKLLDTLANCRIDGVTAGVAKLPGGFVVAPIDATQSIVIIDKDLSTIQLSH